MYLDFKKLHILVAEDLIPMQQLMSQLLGSLGVGQVSTASDGKKAYRIYQLKKPDIIITDWQMPDVDGLEFVKNVRLQPDSHNRVIPIIMMTGFCAKERISTARDNGVTEFIIKPFSANDIAARITHIIKMPRDFIISPDFIGPDRRRKDKAAPDKDNRTGKIPCKKIPAPKILQEKTGIGKLNPEIIKRSQRVLDENKIDFVPIAKHFLEQLSYEIEKARKEENPGRRTLENIIGPVMQIKANAYIFKYSLISDLATIMLNFLENLNMIDEYILQIIDANQRTLIHIIDNEMKGDTGSVGEALKKELEGACSRYMTTKFQIMQNKFKKLTP